MLGRTVVRLAVMVFVMAVAGVAQGQDKIQDYFNDAARKVKATEDPAQKREILSKSFESMASALEKVQSSPLISKEDKAGIAYYRSVLSEKQDELAGNNGFERVSDAQLNAFSNYTVQDIEQAAQNVTISLVALLLIIIIAILLV